MKIIRTLTALLFLAALCSETFAAVTPALRLTPATVELRPGQTIAFSLTAVGGAQTNNLKWTLSSAGSAVGAALGVFTPGTLTYAAPATLPQPNIVTLQVQDPANAAVSATATITILNPGPSITGLEPSTINSGLPYSVKINGSGFVKGSQVLWDGVVVNATTDANGALVVSGNAAPAAGKIQVTVRNPDPGGKTSSARTLTITPVQVDAGPDGKTLRTGGTVTLTAKVLNNADQTVTWSVQGGATFGSVDASGVYRAPSVLPTPPTAVVIATAKADPKATDSVSISLLNVVPSLSSLEPSVINTGLPYSVVIKGSGIVAGAQVQFGNTTVPSTFSNGSLTITGVGPAVGGVPIAVINPTSGNTPSNTKTLNVLTAIEVQLTPDGRTVRCGATLPLYAKVVNNPNQAVTWAVNGAGTVDDKGIYTAPKLLPALTDVTVTAKSNADLTKSATVTIHLVNPAPAITSIAPATLKAGDKAFTISGSGFAQNATVYFAGAKMAATWISDTSLSVAGDIAPVAGGTAAIKVMNPDPGSAVSAPIFVAVSIPGNKMAYPDAVRFLELASWGPSPASVAQLMSVGRDAWLAEQFAMPPTPYPAPNDAGDGVSRLQDAFFTNALTGQDQLRQRVAFALSQIFVVSAEKNTKFIQVAPYMAMLSNNAFGNFRTLMELVTKHPSMGYFLDMVNNDKANPARNTVANENYARELMQLFTLGLTALNPDGSTGAGAAPYDEAAVKDLAKVMTGWTYAPQPNFASKWTNPQYYFDPMVAFEEHHDKTEKKFALSSGACSIAQGGTAQSDLTRALDCIFNHPNVAPFISYRLIQRLVTSSPSSKYVQDVAGVFTASKGDLKQVVTAILTHAEAQQPVKLNEPVLFATRLLRSLNANVTTAATGVRGQTEAMGQEVFSAPSVFNYFSPFYRVQGNVAPEFQIVNAATVLARINFVNRVVSNSLSGNVKVDFSNWDDLATNADRLVEAVNQALYRGGMTADEKAALKAGLGDSKSARTLVRNALYVAAASPQYQVEH